jgi:hypothetical protein
MKNKLSLSKSLFWDTAYEKIDYKKNASFIIERVLNYGDKEDVEKLKDMYGMAKIKETAKRINYINKKNLNFWSIILEIPLKSFKCTKKFSTKKQNLFLAK